MLWPAQERVSQCEKARNDLLLQQALMQGQGRMVPGSSHMGPTMFPGQLPNVVQGVAIGLPAGMQVRAQPSSQRRLHGTCCSAIKTFTRTADP